MRKLAGVVLAIGVLSGCGGGGGTAAEGSSSPWGRTFLSSSITEDGKPRPLVTGTRVRMTFDNGELKANAGCNHLGGPVDLANGKLTADQLGMTAIGCEKPLQEQDEWFSKFVSGGPSWRLDGDDLVLTSAGTELRLTDEKTANPDRPLRETRWQVESIVDGQAVSSAPAGAELVFSAGKVEGSTGCNKLSGTAVQAGTIEFSAITTTKMQCADDLQRLETAVLAVLDGPVTQQISADTLVLTHAGGKGLQLRAAN